MFDNIDTYVHTYFDEPCVAGGDVRSPVDVGSRLSHSYSGHTEYT